MDELITLAKNTVAGRSELPFSVYSSVKEQRISNVSISNPLLVFVLSGTKTIGKGGGDTCTEGSFIFLSNSPSIDIRNIPGNTGYFAVLIEFAFSDFEGIGKDSNEERGYIKGEVCSDLRRVVKQYIELSAFAPLEIFSLRRKEILQILYYLGFKAVGNLANPPSLAHKISEIVSKDLSGAWSIERLADAFSMSVSTLRRKLKSEGTDIQAIRDNVRLGYGLHLVQTTLDSIGRISELCGYQSQSRFTDKFKRLFGVTPTALRKTRFNN